MTMTNSFTPPDHRSPLEIFDGMLENQTQKLRDEMLLWRYQEIDLTIQKGRLLLNLLEFEILKRMEQRGGTGLHTELYTAETSASVSYDQKRLLPLLEIFAEVDLKTCFTPEHEVATTVPSNFNMVKTKALAKRYGDEALRIVEVAKLPGRSKLTVERRKRGKVERRTL